MLQTIVRNGEVIKSFRKYQSSDKEKVPIGEQKVPIGEQKVPIEEQKVPIEKLLVEKSISEIMKNSIIDLYNRLEINRVFGRKEVSEILGYSDRNAGKIIVLMRTLQIIEPVNGKGKGKYIFKIGNC